MFDDDLDDFSLGSCHHGFDVVANIVHATILEGAEMHDHVETLAIDLLFRRAMEVELNQFVGLARQ